jgi:hypothetical protein
MRNYVILLSTFLLTVLSGCGSAHKTVRPEQGQLNNVKTLAVVVDQDKEFELFYSRASADGTGAALFGVVGATVGASIDENEDKEKAKLMAPAISNICCKSIFSEALLPLQQNNRFEKVQIIKEGLNSDQFDGYDAVVFFTVKKWGLRLVEQRTDMVSGFIEIDVKMRTIPDNKTIWEERQVIAGRGRENLREYISNAELLQNELTQTIKDAGTRMSNLLIY